MLRRVARTDSSLGLFVVGHLPNDDVVEDLLEYMLTHIFLRLRHLPHRSTASGDFTWPRLSPILPYIILSVPS